MKVGDRVKMPSGWREEPAKGTVDKVSPEYIIIKWDDSNAAWHYNKKESEKIEIIGTDLSDQQLEHVHGGMGYGRYEIWKTRWINQDW